MVSSASGFGKVAREWMVSMKGPTNAEGPGCVCVDVCEKYQTSIPDSQATRGAHKDATEQSSHHESTPPRPIMCFPLPPFSLIPKQSSVNGMKAADTSEGARREHPAL